MGRSADIKTKAVATRVPMADYIKILQESSAKGISVSDYVSLKLANDVDIKLKDGGNLITVPVRIERDESKSIYKKLETEALNYKNKVSELEKEISALKLKENASRYSSLGGEPYAFIDQSSSKLIEELFKVNLKSTHILNNHSNPYYDLLNKLQQKLDLLNKKQPKI